MLTEPLATPAGSCWLHSAAEYMSTVAVMAEDWRSKTVDSVRHLILEATPDVVEEVKWRKSSNPDGVPTFSRSGLVCTVETYKDKGQGDVLAG